jgi:formylglycine-generating enzyme required for sulfatase activity
VIRRSRALGAGAILLVLQGCELVLGTDRLQERTDGSGREAGFADAGDATAPNEAGATMDVNASADDGSAGSEAAHRDGNSGADDADTADGSDADADAADVTVDDGPPSCGLSCATGLCDEGGTTCTGFTSGTTNPSCASSEDAGQKVCGPGNESCCTSLEVPGGTFYRTYTNDQGDGGAVNEADPASVSGFRLDKYLVTVGRFRTFVAAWNNGAGFDGGPGYEPQPGQGKHTHVNGGSGLNATGYVQPYEPGWTGLDEDAEIQATSANLGSCSPSTWTDSPGTNENLPINCVNWFEAYAFCIWDGGFLPSEAEWEYAAAGGGGPQGQRLFPWGSTDPRSEPGYPFAYAVYETTSPYPVGTTFLGEARWGQLDLVGEVWEWTLDLALSYVPCTDCVELSSSPLSGSRAIRGANYNDGQEFLAVTWAYLFDPKTRDWGIGFRCARTP